MTALLKAPPPAGRETAAAAVEGDAAALRRLTNRVPLGDLVPFLRRELAVRERVVPKWIESGRLTADQAQRELDCLSSLLSHVQVAQILPEILTFHYTGQGLAADWFVALAPDGKLYRYTLQGEFKHG